MQALARVHAADGYPNRWPIGPRAWLDTSTQIAAWVATRDDSIEGHVALDANVVDPVLATAACRPLERLVSVSRLFVQPHARGTGLGGALLVTAANHALVQGLGPVLDVVDDATVAIALYERLGWQLVDRHPAHWTMNNGTRPLARRYVLR